jgi:hypothetical protein
VLQLAPGEVPPAAGPVDPTNPEASQ